MANYSSYKSTSITSANIDAGSIDNPRLAADVRTAFGIQWIRGNISQCTVGCCCLWTVPANIKQLKFELWGAGGNGHGACVNQRCQHYMGAGGGTYNTKSITSAPGCTYTVCAGGVYPCLSIECSGCNGCTSYVNGYNLSNFCACGGSAGCANSSWTDSCFSAMDACRQAGESGGDMANFTHAGPWGAAGSYMYPGDACHCWKHNSYSTGTIMGIGTGTVDQFTNLCWMRCGCWTVPYASGGQGAKTSYCGSNCCGQGGTGGSGVVKITYY
tara:strand:+ start:3141 stop:3953 length:813 start_codon:yes stop_codon:yes gene_type:complete